MEFDHNFSILYSDILLPDLFITEYMPSLDCSSIKIYLYILFLTKHKKRASIKELSKILQIEYTTVKESLSNLENLGLIIWKDTKTTVTDIKETEIKKIYRLKSSSTPCEAVFSSERNKKRNEVITSISNTFFNSVMSPSWYTDIDTWFDRYKFDEDVMMYLFRHCYDNNALCKSYIVKVAENWYNKGIQNVFQLEKYMEEHKLYTTIKGKIIKKLRYTRNLTEYEDIFLNKWVFKYNYDFNIIEIALQLTSGKTNPSFNYLDKVISTWFENKLTTKEEILKYCEDLKATRKAEKLNQNLISSKPIQATNYEQREYDDEFFDSLYVNLEYIK